MDIYIDPESWDLQTSNQFEKTSLSKDKNKGRDWQVVPTNHRTFSMGKSVLEINSNIMQICLLLEGIGVFAKVS